MSPYFILNQIEIANNVTVSVDFFVLKYCNDSPYEDRAMLQSKYYRHGMIGLLSCFSAMTYADNAWGGYSGVERRSYHQTTPSYQQPAQDPLHFLISAIRQLLHLKAITINLIKIAIHIRAIHNLEYE